MKIVSIIGCAAVVLVALVAGWVFPFIVLRATTEMFPAAGHIVLPASAGALIMAVGVVVFLCKWGFLRMSNEFGVFLIALSVGSLGVLLMGIFDGWKFVYR